MKTEFASLYELFEAIPNEDAAIAHFRAIRWKNGAFCPYCGCVRIYDLKGGKRHKCGDCKNTFSIKVGTIFEDTKIPLRKWLAAIWLITSHKKGIASTQLARDIAVTQKTAWFMLHRLRHAARTRSFNRPLGGEVEVDETFIGGKGRNRRKGTKTGRVGAQGKAIVMGLLERGGEWTPHLQGPDRQSLTSRRRLRLIGEHDSQPAGWRVMSDSQRQTCKSCGRPDKFNFHVPDDVWARVVPRHLQHLVVCLYCFDEFATQRDVTYATSLDTLYFAGDRATFRFTAAFAAD